jgi:hypothetical protein
MICLMLSLPPHCLSRDARARVLAGGGGGGWSAMARTVGIPAAITAQLLLDGGVAARGVLRPMTREVYAPVLDKLRAEGIEFREKSFDIAK